MKYKLKMAIYVTESEINAALLDWARTFNPEDTSVVARLDDSKDTLAEYPDSVFVEFESLANKSLRCEKLEKLFAGTDFDLDVELNDALGEDASFISFPEEISKKVIENILLAETGMLCNDVALYSNAESNGIVAYGNL